MERSHESRAKRAHAPAHMRIASAAIRRINYNALEKVLRLEFAGGAVYDYYDVPQGVYENFLSAPSPGRFFACHLRDKFSFEKKTATRLH